LVPLKNNLDGNSLRPGVDPAWARQKETLKKAADWNEAAVQSFREHDWNEAETGILKAMVYAGEHPKMRRNLGVVYYEKGNEELRNNTNILEAERLLKKAYDIDPGSERYRRAYAAAVIARAESEAENGYIEEALRLYGRGAFLDSGNVAVWIKASEYAWSVQRIPLALAYYEEAANLDPEHRGVLHLADRMKELHREEEYRCLESEHFVLAHGEMDSGAVTTRHLLDELEAAYEEAAYQFGRTFDRKLTVVFYPHREFYEFWDMPEHVTAFYDGKLRLPQPSKASDLASMRGVVRHELTHALFHWVSAVRLPRWFEEGVAQWSEGFRLTDKMREFLVRSEEAYSIPTLEEMDDLIGWTNRYAYVKAYSVMDYLIRKYGISEVMRFVQRLDSEDGFGEAFYRYFGLSFQQLEEEWRQWLFN